MPVIKSAKKKLRKDKKVTLQNNELRKALKAALKEATKKPTDANLKKAFQVIDKATKKNIHHKNKAARLKSKLSRPSVKKVKTEEIKKPITKTLKTKKASKKKKSTK
jgi:small subunit ribosomal protein S20